MANKMGSLVESILENAQDLHDAGLLNDGEY